MRAYERFLEYVRVSTASDPKNENGKPSSNRQFALAEKLAAEMKTMGIADARSDELCYVYGHIPATPGCEDAPALGLLAHLDTSPDASGENVEPLLHKNYDGGDVVLPSGHIIRAAIFPNLAKCKGETLITASGNTLLGADDKAGIAEIMTVCEELLKGKTPHGKICIGFTPDEEIGAGAGDLDLEAFGADFAYTLDGGDVDEIEYETFNAAWARLAFHGVEVHPGTAKNIMVNAVRLAAEFDSLLPQGQRPEYTEGREGFYHLHSLCGEVKHAEAEYLLREHDREKFEEQKRTIQKVAEEIRERYGKKCLEVAITDSYFNMGEIIEKHFHLVENAQQAICMAGLAPVTKPIRGGTDGSALSFRGLPCPNLGTGGFYAHGPNECITTERMDKMVDVVLNVVSLYAKNQPGEK